MPNKHKNRRAANQAAPAVAFPSDELRPTVVVVGGGASGIAAACALSACAHNLRRDVRVVILEKGCRLGSSILRSGNGRCNFSHEDIDPESFNHPEFVFSTFKALESAFATSSFAFCDDAPKVTHDNAVLKWFAHLGLVWREAPLSGGALYPFSNKATSVLEVLQAELDRYAVEQYCNIVVGGISRCCDRFQIELQSASDTAERAYLSADALVYAAGGTANVSCERTGLFETFDRSPITPVLGPLKTKTELLAGLDGIRAKVRLTCEKRHFSEEGEVLFRTYGVSGIVVFNASRFVEPGDIVTLDFVPERPLDRLKELLRERARFQTVKNGCAPTYAELLRGFFLPELSQAIIRACLSGDSSRDAASSVPVDGDGLDMLAETIKSFELEVTGRGEAGQCQVHRGGIGVDMLDPHTMMTYRIPNLYFTGEALDVDGPCGGYNLHWAWTSGLLAGLSIAHGLFDQRSQQDWDAPEAGA